MSDLPDFKIEYIVNGFCRIVYSAHNEDNKKVYYCLQDEGCDLGGIVCYRCSNSDGEPCCPIHYDYSRFEIPTGNTEIEISIRNCIKLHIQSKEK